MSYRDNLFEQESKTVRDVFRRQAELRARIIFLVEKDVLVGVISDGDIRRFILSGGNLDAPALDAATRKPYMARDRGEAARILAEHPTLKAVPIVDSEGKVTDVFNGNSQKESSIHIPVVINAGGMGTRLDPYTRILPKPMIPIGNYPIIELIMRRFERWGCNDFSIIVNYKKQIIKAYFTESERIYKICWYDEEKPLGTGGGLAFLKGKMKRTFFFSSCDTLIWTDYSCILDLHRENKNLVTIVCAYKNIEIPYGIIEIGKNGEIGNIKEKPKFSYLTNTGLYLVEPMVLDYIENGEFVGFPEIVERIRGRGGKVGIYPVSEQEWLDMGAPEELDRMYKVFSEMEQDEL